MAGFPVLPNFGHLHVLTEIDQDSVTLSTVRHGLGITLMPRLALSPVPAGLVTLPLPEPLTRSLVLAALPHRAGLPLIRAFTSALVDSLGSLSLAGQPVYGHVCQSRSMDSSVR